MTSTLTRLGLCLFIALALAGSIAAGGQSAIKREGKNDAEAWVQLALALTGKTRDDAIAALGAPDSTVKSDQVEYWKYRRLFGAYRRKKAIFGHISLSWEVRLELVFKDGTVASVKTSGVREVHRQRGEITQ
jgi:hypothetical protein